MEDNSNILQSVDSNQRISSDRTCSEKLPTSSNPGRDSDQNVKNFEEIINFAEPNKSAEQIKRKKKLNKLDNLFNTKLFFQASTTNNTLHNKYKYDIFAQGDRNYETLAVIEQLNLNECYPSPCSSESIDHNGAEVFEIRYNDSNDDSNDEYSKRSSHYYPQGHISPIDEISERSENSAILHEMLIKKDQETRAQIERVLEATRNANIHRLKCQKKNTNISNNNLNTCNHTSKKTKHILSNEEKQEIKRINELMSMKNVNTKTNNSSKCKTTDCVLHFKCSPTSWSSQSPRFKDFELQVDENCLIEEQNEHFVRSNHSCGRKLSQATFSYNDSSRNNNSKDSSKCCIHFFKCCMSSNKKSM